MSGKLIPNPPSHEQVLENLRRTRKQRKFDVTIAVRDAVADHGADPEHYAVIAAHLKGGKITGSKVADAYKLAEHLVEWEASVGSTSLKSALQRGEIQLNAIVKRLPSILRKQLCMDVQAWVCVGGLLEYEALEEAELQVVNG